MNSFVKDLLTWSKGFKEGRSTIERDRVERIRRSDIVESLESFDLAFEHAKTAAPTKPTTGLVKLREIYSRLYR